MERIDRVYLTAYDARETKEILIQLCWKNVQTERYKRHAPDSRSLVHSGKRNASLQRVTEYRVTLVVVAPSLVKNSESSLRNGFSKFREFIFAYQKCDNNVTIKKKRFKQKVYLFFFFSTIEIARFEEEASHIYNKVSCVDRCLRNNTVHRDPMTLRE